MIWNKYVLLGILLIVIGFFLSPILIGIPIMIVGFLIGDFGILLSVVRMVPGLEKKIKSLFLLIIESYKPYFRKRVKKEKGKLKSEKI